jgi:putative ABC transport system ATP-binding protein
MVRIVNLKKSFNGIEALDGVDLNVNKGEVVVIIGPSGSGKSTLLRCVNQLEQQTSGDIFINGERVTSDQKQLDSLRSRVGMVFQHFNLYPHLTVLENITLAQRIVKRTSAAEAVNNAKTQLERVGILEKIDAYPAQLSGGQQQRVSIGRALMNAPAVMLADEPTGSLDSRNGYEIIKLLKASNKRYRQTLIIVTHDENIALQADRIIGISDGKVVRDERVRP